MNKFFSCILLLLLATVSLTKGDYALANQESRLLRQGTKEGGFLGEHRDSDAPSASPAGVSTDPILSSPEDKDDGGPNTGAIVGGVIGGVAAVAVLALVYFLHFKDSKKPVKSAEEEEAVAPTVEIS